MPPFKDEHVLIIAPGSQTTLAQLGLPESFTPARWRFPTRMFPAEKPGEWEPHKVRTKTVAAPAKAEITTNGDHAHSQPDTVMKDAPNTDGDTGTLADVPASQSIEDSAEPVYEDDLLDTEGAVYPIREGRIENWSCLFALFSHIYNMLSPSFAYHSPVLVVSQPCWSARDHELLTQFFFENFKIPAFCIMDSALTACYAYGVGTATVVDVGHEKCDVSAVTDFIVNDYGRGVGMKGCGGRGLTLRLQQVLEKQGFDEDMAEQLKRNPICEVLPAGIALPRSSMQNGEYPSNPAAAASTGAMDSGANAKDADGLRLGQLPRGPGLGTEVGEEGDDLDEDNEGVLDVAAIVAKDNAAELLAKREREKAEKAAAKKGALDAAKQVRLKNSEKEKASFTYEEIMPFDPAANFDGISPSRKRKREIEVGVERFMASTPADGYNDGIIDTIAATIHNTILTHPELSQRSTLWDNLIIMGNGSRIKGFTSSLLSTLATRYTLSPSTATIFTSELPSNFSTPLPTNGTNTPIPGLAPHPMHHSAVHGVNPLLVAATSRAMQPQNHLQVPQMAPDTHQLLSHKSHSQTPTSIRTVRSPEYFPEWRDPAVSGMEEAGFLGAQVAAKVIFIVDQGLSKGFLTRVEYNEMGPAGIHECSM